ncbi:electron transfer flavoprotein subunit beta/FixA family protein [Catalinimonas niigatensis]|uniref:electron transfer flavoprotein subunit beta/FixA family protein n=1 Tax=Catalinimonas niigatensis TaxID=1397264 RepID=UPI002665987D|nr:electron transfer flavoprotein subunit beta/FixA family protein [Catalinimonas niigatensis]WPP51311.1 electron transfer flavoprotein subunit beta/FixA family protein [Catalinimonas niigatensis]
MKILVCITHVPDTTSKIAFTDNNTKFDPSGVQFIIGPYDDYALARAVELKEQQGGSVTLLNVGTASTEPTIRKGLAIGADDAIRINAEPLDALFVAKQIAAIVKEGAYDLVLMGRESIDYNGGQVHGMVGELVGMPSISPVMQLDIEGDTAKLAREIEGGKEYLEVKLPLIAGCQEPIAEWKIPNMRGIMSARQKPLQVKEPIGEASTSSLRYELPPPKGQVKMIDPEHVEELVKALKNDIKVL